jgi:type II secretory pathway pseudopilin PulG
MPELPPPLPPVVTRKKGLPAIVWVMIVLAVGLPVIGVLAAAGFAGGSVAIKKAKKISALAAANELETAINQFYGEYSFLPDSSKPSPDRVFDTSSPQGQQLLSILMGTESSPAPQNSKKLQFYIGRPGAGGKNGLIALPSGLPELKDPWGKPYQVIIDGDYDETLIPPANSGSPTPVRGHRVLVYSLGQDGKGGAGAVRTW